MTTWFLVLSGVYLLGHKRGSRNHTGEKVTLAAALAGLVMYLVMRHRNRW